MPGLGGRRASGDAVMGRLTRQRQPGPAHRESHCGSAAAATACEGKATLGHRAHAGSATLPKALSWLQNDPTGAAGAARLGNTKHRYWLQRSSAGTLCCHPRFTSTLDKRSGLGAAGRLFNV